jgi:hypothetical protein
MASNDSIVVMDGPGPFFFDRLQEPLRLVPAPHADAVAIEGEMIVDETGRRVTVCIPIDDAQAVRLWRMLGNYKKAKGLPDPAEPA